jgi:hypothetical protein
VTPLDPRVYRTSIHKLAISVSLQWREQVLAISFDLVGSENYVPLSQVSLRTLVLRSLVGAYSGNSFVERCVLLLRDGVPL